MTTPFIHVSGLRMARGAFTLGIGDWSVHPGEVVGLVGPNGAGKTTLLELLHGQLKPDSGAVRMFGVDPWIDPVTVRRRAGYAAPDHALFPVDVATMLQILPAYYPSFDEAWAHEVQQRLGIGDDWNLDEVSTGQRTRMRILAALCFRPAVLLLDEPAAGLDAGNRHRLLELVLDMAADGDRAIVLSSHLLHDVERIADRVLVLSEGRKVFEGQTHELVKDGRSLEETMVQLGVAG